MIVGGKAGGGVVAVGKERIAGARGDVPFDADTAGGVGVCGCASRVSAPGAGAGGSSRSDNPTLGLFGPCFAFQSTAHSHSVHPSRSPGFGRLA